MSTVPATIERGGLAKPEGALADTMNLGQLLARSGYFQDARDMAQAVVKVLAGRELGFGPIASMTGIYIVKGRVTLSANLMAAAIKRSGRYNYRITEHSDQACAIEFFDGGQVVGTSRFTLEDAKRAGLSGDNWRGYPRNMLFARALSNGAKWHCADVFGGPVYTPDELGVAVSGETGEPEKLEAISPRPTLAPPVVVEASPQAEPQQIIPGTPSYEPFGAVTMLSKMAGKFVPEAMEEAFGPGIRNKSALEKLRGENETLYRVGYDRLHKKYEAWKAQQAQGAA